MMNLHETALPPVSSSFTLWFWMKAGFGLALGFFLLFIPLWVMIVLGGFGLVGALLGVGRH